ncbi:hypothetical protein GNF80_16330 [Clostridium perfringens]|nr:hypothetical protein [Clostridium perfringens]
MNFKKNIIKIFSVVTILITMFVLFVKSFSFKFYLASITKDFGYLDNNLLFSEADKKLIIENSSAVSGAISILLILIGIIFIIMLIINMFNTRDKMVKKTFIFILPYILVSIYGILDLINISLVRNISKLDFLGFLIYFIFGVVPLLMVISVSGKVNTYSK